MTVAFVMHKGGGYGRGVRLTLGAPSRHRHWTGTNDDVPRTTGVPPLNGGMPETPSMWGRFKRWLRYYFRWGRPEYKG